MRVRPNFHQLLAVRFLIGVAEGGVWPAMLVILSHWFPNAERGRANAYFIMNIAIASIVTGPLSGLDHRHLRLALGLHRRRPVVLLLVLIWYPLISDSPAKAKWISPAEKQYPDHPPGGRAGPDHRGRFRHHVLWRAAEATGTSGN